MRLIITIFLVPMLACSQQTEIILRCSGRSNLSVNDPLFIVDSVLRKEVYSLNESHIASITFMKGKDAIHIYGQAAADGAFIITTQKQRHTNKCKTRDKNIPRYAVKTSNAGRS